MQAQDIMRSEVQCVSETTTLRELSHAFRQYSVTTLAVVDDKNQLVGVVNEDDLLRAMMPSYSELQDNLSYMQDFEFLEDRAQEVENLPVRDIMIRGTISVPPIAPRRSRSTKLTMVTRNSSGDTAWRVTLGT